MKTARLRYGTGRLDVTLPDSATVLQGPPIPAVADPADAVRAALADPIGSPPLAEVVRRKRPDSVAITISDITRPVPNEPIVSALLDVLNANGVRDEQVVVLVATGMHRPSTAAERVTLLGRELPQRVRVIDHEADDAASLVRVSDDPPVSVNGRFVRAGLRIVTGLIEPHFMAGYSGGRKGVCPGLVDLETVRRFHGFATMADPRSAEGNLDANPCHDIGLKVARLVGVDFLVNAAVTHDRRLAGVYAGDMEAAHAAGCRQVAAWTAAAVAEPFDLVVTCAGGYPLDANFYQSVKGMVGALPALHAGSTLLIVSACHEVGSPEYAGVMLRYCGDWRRFLGEIAATDRVVKDQWQYQMQARVLERIGVERLRLVNAGLPMELQRQLSVNPVAGGAGEGGRRGAGGDDVGVRCQRFIDDYVRAHPGATVAAIPEGPYTMLTRRP